MKKEISIDVKQDNNSPLKVVKRNKHTESIKSEIDDSHLVKAINHKIKTVITPYKKLDNDQKVIVNISNLEINNINNNNNSLLVSARDGRVYNETKNDSMILDFDNKKPKDNKKLLKNSEQETKATTLAVIWNNYKKFIIPGIIVLILLIILIKLLN
jgi:hypothetical protein